MSVKSLSLNSIQDLITKASQNETADYIFILPSLETKKEMVETMALKLKTVPDKRILRLNEFFLNLAQEAEPLLQFLDKDLLAILLKDSLNKDKKSEPYVPLTQVALDYISIFSPILGREIYREALEEFIETDPNFLKNYGDIYGFMTRIWDDLNSNKRILPNWSLGWLYRNLKSLEAKPKTVYILGFNKLKQIEKDFFEELAMSWEIVDVHLSSKESDLKENQNHIVSVTSLADEIAWVLDFLKQRDSDEVINFIIPKTKWFYKEILEVFAASEVQALEEDKESLRSKINNFLSPLKVTTEDYKDTDIQNLLSQKREDLKNHTELQQQINNVFDVKLLKEKMDVSAEPPKGNISFFSFLDWTLTTKVNFKDEVLRKLYSISLQIPNNLAFSYQDWLSFIGLKLNAMSPSLKSQKFNFYTIEEMPWRMNETNVFLSCTRSDYEKGTFAYLTEFEVEKIKSDLGFDLEGIGQAENFKRELSDNAMLSQKNYFVCPLFDHLGTSQQSPKFIEEIKLNPSTNILDNLSDFKPKPLKSLTGINECRVENFKIKSLSASSLQRYIDEPYSFYLEKVLNLKDDEALDIDPSHLMSGSIFHLLLEKGVGSQLDQDQLELIVKEEISQFYKLWSNTKSQEIQMTKYVEDIAAYITKDDQDKKQTGRKTLYLEKAFEAYFDLKDLRFYSENAEGRICFKGKIDRIDVINGRSYVIDYKSSKSSIDNIKNLSSYPQVQMPLYAMIVKDGIIDCKEPLGGLIYIAIKDQFEVIPSLIMADKSQDILGESINSRNTASADEAKFEGVISEYRKFISETIKKMKHNTFSPLLFEGESRSFYADF